MRMQAYARDNIADTQEPALETFLQCLHYLQAIDRNFPLQYAVCLTEIARDEGLSPSTLAERTNLGLSTVSRIIAALGEHRPNGHSYQLIRITISDEERRRKRLFLTNQGQALIERALSCIKHS